jgi:dUTP pyrophosphatase
VVRLSQKAILPTRSTTSAAGYDLYSAYNYVIPANGKCLVKTDLQISVPNGTYGRIAPRSGLAWKKYINIGAGVIDNDYRGNLCIVMFNHSNENVFINCGDRVAQLICEKIVCPIIKEYKKLAMTERGTNSFGSSGP